VRAKLGIFSIITPVVSVPRSFRNHMLIWLIVKKHLLLLSMLKTAVLFNGFVETVIQFQDYLMRKLKRPSVFRLLFYE